MIYLVVTFRHTGLRLRDLALNLWRPALAAGVMALVVLAAGLQRPLADVAVIWSGLHLALAVLVGALVYGATLWLAWLVAGRPAGRRCMFWRWPGRRGVIGWGEDGAIRRNITPTVQSGSDTRSIEAGIAETALLARSRRCGPRPITPRVAEAIHAETSLDHTIRANITDIDAEVGHQNPGNIDTRRTRPPGSAAGSFLGLGRSRATPRRYSVDLDYDPLLQDAWDRTPPPLSGAVRKSIHGNRGERNERPLTTVRGGN